MVRQAREISNTGYYLKDARETDKSYEQALKINLFLWYNRYVRVYP